MLIVKAHNASPRESDLYQEHVCETPSEAFSLVLQEVSAAYAILSDPSKRKKYDQQGFSGIEAAEVDLQVELSEGAGLLNACPKLALSHDSSI